MGVTHASAAPTRGRLAELVLRHRRLVALFWLAVTAAGVLLAGQVTGRFSSTEELPGLPSYQAAEVLQHSYGIGNSPPVAVVVTLPASRRVASPAGRSELATILSPLSADHSLRVVSYLSTGGRRLVAAGGRSTVALVYGGTSPPTSAQLTSRIRSSAPTSAVLHATSLPDLASGASSRPGIGVLAEGLIGGLAALLVLAVVFGSLLALVPLVIAVVSILATFLLIGAVSTVAPVSNLVEYLIALIGLGVAIDYSLLLITRWREERARGLGVAAPASRPAHALPAIPGTRQRTGQDSRRHSMTGPLLRNSPSCLPPGPTPGDPPPPATQTLRLDAEAACCGPRSAPARPGAEERPGNRGQRGSRGAQGGAGCAPGVSSPRPWTPRRAARRARLRRRRRRGRGSRGRACAHATRRSGSGTSFGFPPVSAPRRASGGSPRRAGPCAPFQCTQDPGGT